MLETSLIIGVWNATTIQVVPIIMLAHFFMNGDNVAGYLDVPSQNIYKLRIDIFEQQKSKLYFNVTSIKFSFEGVQNGSSLNGVLIQGVILPLEFRKIKNQSEYTVNRPQTPKRPYRYNEEKVEIKSGDDVILSGTFTYPRLRKSIAGVVLCHGSGGQDRDETIMDHKPFMVIANHLTNHGIAVLRFDERGIRNSTGNFSIASDIDFAEDALAGINFLRQRRETKKSRLGLIGHSKGGFTSIIASNRSKSVEFIGLLGSPSVTGEEILYEQTRLILEAQNVSQTTIDISIEVAYNTYQIIKKEQDVSVVKLKLQKYFADRLQNATGQEKIDLENAMRNVLAGIEGITTPWFRSFLVFDPIGVLSHMRIPVLGLWGSKDLQVPASQNFEPMKKALEKAENKNFKLMTFNDLNHLFQKSRTGLPDEYGIIEETVSVNVLETLTKWIIKTTSSKLRC